MNLIDKVVGLTQSRLANNMQRSILVAGYDASLIFAIRPQFEVNHPCACFPTSFSCGIGGNLGMGFLHHLRFGFNASGYQASIYHEGEQRQHSWPDGLESCEEWAWGNFQVDLTETDDRSLACWADTNGMICSISLSYDLFEVDAYAMLIDESHSRQATVRILSIRYNISPRQKPVTLHQNHFSVIR